MARTLYLLASALLLLPGVVDAETLPPPLSAPHEQSPQASRGRCTGVVKDAKGEPILGASVRVKGTTTGATTDAEGRFSFAGAQSGALIEVSCVGFASQTLRYTGAPLTITLQEDSKLLDDVVVIGYGVQRKVNLTGAVSSVKGTELAQRPVADATQSLQGLVPGLLVSNTASGRPGGVGSLALRGQGNLSGSATPYVLVDGVEMSLSDINPNDIENISVLKDAAASAIYGARAAYGVILVTTKKGRAGKMHINYQGTMGWNSPTVLPRMVNSYDFARYWNEGARNAGSGRLYSDKKMELLRKYIEDPSSVDPWQELPQGVVSSMNPAFENSESGIGNVDYFALHYKPSAHKQSHNLSLSGGSETTQYYISGGYYTEDGIMRYAKMGFDRYNFASNVSSQLKSWLKVKVNTKYRHSQVDTPFGKGGLSEGFYHSLARFRPTVSPRDPHGHFTELSMVPYLQSGTFTRLKRDDLNLTLGLEARPLKDWLIFLDYTHRIGGSEYEALNKAPKIYASDGKTTSLGVRDELSVYPQGKYTRSFEKVNYQSINLYSNYLLDLGENNHFTFMLGYQEEQSHTSYLETSITGLFSLTNPNAGLGSGDKVPVDKRYGWATRGFFGRINYNYAGRYLLEVNGRYDGSSRFAPSNRWGFFPSFSLGWNIHQEKFMAATRGVLSNLKLRASYGLLGNQAGADLYTFAATMELSKRLGSYYFQDGRHTYTQAPAVVDPNTTWEKVSSRNIGIDFGFLDNSLTGSLELFQRDTKDMLGPSLPLPDFFGAQAPKTNNAEMRNRGWELSLNYRGRIGKEITYNLGAQISDATSIVTKYASADNSAPQSNWYAGRSVGEIWGYRADGLIQTQAEADEYNRTHDLSYLSALKWAPGDVKYRDLNGDGKINIGENKLGSMGDMTVIGDTTPRYQFTFNGSISWRGLSLSFMLQGVGKRDWHPGRSIYFWGWGPYAQVTVFKEHFDYWTPERPNAYYPRPYIHSNGGIAPFQAKNKTTSDRYLQNAAYCRLKNVTLSYELPSQWTKGTKVQVFLSGENLLTITKLKKMFDPEAIFTRSDYTAEGGKNYPLNRVLSFGLIVNL